MKLTDWFENGIQPAIPGVYQTFDDETYQYWDGRHWGYCASLPKYCMTPSEYGPGNFQSPKWRGLAEDPNGSKP